MTQVAFVLLWVLVGHGMAAAAWFGLINTPESNILMLAVSASLVVVGALVLLGVALAETARASGGRTAPPGPDAVTPVPASGARAG